LGDMGGIMAMSEGPSLLFGVIARHAPNLINCQMSSGNYHEYNFQQLSQHCSNLESFEYHIDLDAEVDSSLEEVYFLTFNLNILFDRCQNLQSLKIKNDSTLNVGLGSFVSQYPCFHTLKEVRLRNIMFHDGLAFLLTQLFSIPQLEILDWAGFHCSDELLGAAFPDDSPVLCNERESSLPLCELALQYSFIETHTSFDLINVSKFLKIIQRLYPQLEKLLLSFPNLQDEHLIEILTFYGSKKLKRLNFDCQRYEMEDVFMATVEFKEALMGCQSLQTLEISGYKWIANEKFLKECLTASTSVLHGFKINARPIEEKQDDTSVEDDETDEVTNVQEYVMKEGEMNMK
jgi:hypothetical protein